VVCRRLNIRAAKIDYVVSADGSAPWPSCVACRRRVTFSPEGLGRSVRANEAHPTGGPKINSVLSRLELALVAQALQGCQTEQGHGAGGLE